MWNLWEVFIFSILQQRFWAYVYSGSKPLCEILALFIPDLSATSNEAIFIWRELFFWREGAPGSSLPGQGTHICRSRTENDTSYFSAWKYKCKGGISFDDCKVLLHDVITIKLGSLHERKQYNALLALIRTCQVNHEWFITEQYPESLNSLASDG